MIKLHCKINAVRRERFGAPLDFTNRIENMVDFLSKAYIPGHRIEIEIPSGELMIWPPESDVFKETFGLSRSEWLQSQRDAATKIELKELLPDIDEKLVSAYLIADALKERNLRGENVYVEWDNHKFYSIDTPNIETTVSRTYGMDDREYLASLRDGATYISSLGITDIEKVAEAMVEAYKRGLNIRTRFDGEEIYSAPCPTIKEFYKRNFLCSSREAYLEMKKSRAQWERQSKEIKITSDYEKIHKKLRNLSTMRIEAEPFIKQFADGLKDVYYDSFDKFALDFIKRAADGENVFYRIDNVTHYTCEITCLDDLYQKQFGHTYAEHALQEKKAIEEFLNQHAEPRDMAAIAQKAQELFNKGLPFIDPSVDQSEWREWCDVQCVHDRDLQPFKQAIEVMEQMSDGDYEKAAELLDDLRHQDSKTVPLACFMIEKFRPKDYRDVSEILIKKRDRDSQESEHSQADE